MKVIFYILIVFFAIIEGSQLSIYVRQSNLLNYSSLKSNVLLQNEQQYEAPVSIQIPKIKIDTKIEKVQKDKNGTMDVPQDFNNVGWYSLGPKPGQIGNSVIDGHYDSKTGAAIFYRLSNLQTGDEIYIKDAKGEMRTFIIKDKKIYKNNVFPIQEVFGKTNKRMLNLITCEGVFNTKSQEYLNRLVIYSELKE